MFSEINLIDVESGEKGTAKKRMVFVLFWGFCFCFCFLLLLAMALKSIL